MLTTRACSWSAGSVGWLFVARALQGLATGLALGAASAAMLDLHPRRDPASVGLANGVLSAGGLGLGMLASSALVELAPAPRVLPYVLLLVLFAVAFAGALLMPEPVAERARPRLTPQRPERAAVRAARVPARRARGDLVVVDRRAVLLARAALSASLFDSTDHLVAGIGVFVLAGSGGARPARVRPHARRGSAPSAARSRSRSGMAADRARRRRRLRGALPRRRARRRRGLRRRVPRRPARALGGDPARAPRRGDVGVLRRRLRRALAAGDPRRRARHPARASTRRSRSSARSSRRSRSSSRSRPGARARSALVPA